MSKESKFKEDVEAFEKEYTIDKLKDEIDKGHLNKLEKNLASKKDGKMDLNDSLHDSCADYSGCSSEDNNQGDENRFDSDSDMSNLEENNSPNKMDTN
jgi:hypothetical protein